MEYAPGEKMRFGFTVVGRAAEYMPYFVYAFSKMGEEGIGRLRARYALERMIAENPLSGTREEVFDGELVKNRRLPTSWEDAASAARKMDGTRMRLEFLTPTFVKYKGKICVEAPPFAALVQNLLIRIPMLSAVHCGEVWQEDFKSLVARAGEVETVTDETTWVSFRRYSSFRKKSETLEGLVGRVEEFLPLLHIGQLTHVGKRAVFGLGRYRLRET
jgi:CRISPR-associated endoribonuclease Cas6